MVRLAALIVSLKENNLLNGSNRMAEILLMLYEPLYMRRGRLDAPETNGYEN